MASSASAQQPAQQRNALKEFEARMSNMARLEQTDTVFFSKRISKSMATEVVGGPFSYALFPREFFIKHGTKFGKDVTFMTMENQQAWPIHITLCNFKAPRAQLFAYGLGGWKTFVIDNYIKVGNILIFKLLRWSHFEVVIGRSPTNHENAHEGNALQALIQIASSNDLQLVPKFLVTISLPFEPKHPKNHFYLERDLSLIVPLYFGEFHRHMLQCDELQLKGPTKTISKVMVERTYNEGVQKVRLLHSGWKAFLLLNNLTIGDVLKFSLVAHSSFTIDVVEQIKNY